MESQDNKTLVTVGKLTYANVDLPCDNWAWAIVTDHKGSQEYGEVIVAFLPEYEPDHEMVRRMMTAMEARGHNPFCTCCCCSDSGL